MKKFFAEFKKFITRGNVLDMSVGVIVGGAFTAIVNGMSNFILKPIINWILALLLGKDSLSEIYTFLGDPAYKDVLDADGAVIGKEIDLANSIYIDWGSFINAIINFLLIALVLFVIVRTIEIIKIILERVCIDLEIVLFYIYQFSILEFLVLISLTAQRFFFIAIISVTFDDGAQIHIAILDILCHLYLGSVISQYANIQT